MWNNTLHDPSLFSFHDLIRQVSPGVMKVDGLDIDIGVQGVLVEENRAASIMGHVDAIREKIVVNVVGHLLLICHFPAIYFSTASSLSVGFQLSMLSLLCTTERAAESLVVLFLWEDAAGFLSDASLNSAVALWISTFHCTKISYSLILTHAVNGSVPEETKSSSPDKISFEKGNSRRSGKGLRCLGWMKLHLGRNGGNGASIRSQK